MKLVAVGIAFVASAMAAGCSTIEGVYSDQNGATKIELKSGGKASMTVMTETKDCTYTTDKNKISLDCKMGAPLDLTLSDDKTTLQMPPGSMMPDLKKK
jgi:hypothetical protein